MLEMVLASTLIATIVTIIFQFITNKKSDNLKYITNERVQWRQELRSIAEEIQNADPQNIKSVLVKLKMRINAYGMSLPDVYEKDGHLWLIMRIMENEENIERFELHKELLINFISLLLKQDWEKSKEEVKGNIMNTALLIIYIEFICFLIYFHFVICKLEFSIEVIDMILVIALNTCWLHKDIYRELHNKDYEKFSIDKQDFRDFGLNEKEIRKILLKSTIGSLGVRVVFTIGAGYFYFSKIDLESFEIYIYIITFTLGAFMLEAIKALIMYFDFREYYHSIVLEWDKHCQKYIAFDEKNKENEVII